MAAAWEQDFHCLTTGWNGFVTAWSCLRSYISKSTQLACQSCLWLCFHGNLPLNWHKDFSRGFSMRWLMVCRASVKSIDRSRWSPTRCRTEMVPVNVWEDQLKVLHKSWHQYHRDHHQRHDHHHHLHHHLILWEESVITLPEGWYQEPNVMKVAVGNGTWKWS